MQIKSQIGSAWQSYPIGFPNSSEQSIRHYGFSAEILRRLNPKVAVGIAPGFMRRGTEFEVGFINGFSIGPPRFRSQLFLNYVQLPVLLRAETPVLRGLGVYFQSGVGFSYLLGGYRQATAQTSGFPTSRLELDFDGRDQELNRFDFGWQGSLGLTYPLGKGKLAVSGEFYYGFCDVDQKNTSKNRNWGVGLGYQFLLRKNKD